MTATSRSLGSPATSLVVRMVAVFVCFICLSTAPSAQAETLQPEVALGLEDELSVRERTLLAAAARLKDPPSCRSGACPELARIDPHWRTTLDAIIGRLAGIGGWKAASLARLVPPELVESDLRRNLSVYAGQLAKSLENDGSCTAARREVEPLARGETVKAVLFADTIGGPLGGSSNCFASALGKLRQAARDLRDHVLVAAYAENGSTLYVTVSNSAPEFFRVESVGLKENRLFLFFVKRASRVTTRITHPPRGEKTKLVPIVRTTQFNTSEPLIDDRPPACVAWSIAPEDAKDRLVLFDGEESDTSTITFPRGERYGTQVHDLVVVERGERSRVLARLSVRDSEVPQDRCFTAKFDLTPVDDRRDVAVLAANADPGCLSAGLDGERVRERVERFLRDSGRRPRDARTWADTVTNYAELVANLNVVGESPIGAPRGRLDTRSLLASGASELRRHGFSSIVTAKVSCTQNAKEWDFAVRVTALNVEKLLQRRDEVVGLDLTGVTRTALELASGTPSLDGAFVAALSKTFGARYVRFESAPQRREFHSRVSERFRIFVPTAEDELGTDARDEQQYVVQLDARRFDDEEEAFSVCSALESAGRLRTLQRAEDVWTKDRSASRVASATIRPQPGVESSHELTWSPTSPGHYLVRVALARDAEDPDPADTASYRCVDINQNQTRISLDASFSVNTPSSVGGDARVEQLQYIQLMLSVTRATSVNSHLSLGGAIGYANAVHSRDAPPSWDLSGGGTASGPPYGRDGHLSLTWKRQSLQFGPVVAYEVPAVVCVVRAISCTRGARAFGLVARFIPVFDIGSIDDSSIPSELRRFKDGARGLDLTFSSFLQGGFSVQVDQAKQFYILGTLGFVGWSDYVFGGRDQRAAQSKISYETTITGGVVVGGAYDL